MSLRFATVLAALWLSAATAGAQTPTLPPGFTVTPVLDNATVSVVRITLVPGAREQPHTHPNAMLVVLLSRAEMEMHNGTSHTRGTRKPGDLEFVNKGTPHFAANIGTTPLEALVVAIKPDRIRGGAAPAAQMRPGVTRTPLLDNGHVTVSRLEYEADVRESVHTHPYDVMLVPMMPSRLDIQVGDRKTVRGYAVGEAIWIPRLTPHAVANIGTASFRMMGIAIK